MNLPSEFIDKNKNIIPEFNKFLEILDEPTKKGIIVNTNLINTNDFIKIFPYKISKIPYSDNGFYIDEEYKIGNDIYHHAGLYYSQDPAAGAPINSIDIKSNWRVLDLCAAPGGKSIQIANKLTDGFLISNEYDKKRSQVLYSNIERMGLDNVMITNDTPEHLSKCYQGYFDLVVVDAPCSGEGMFRKNDDAINMWSLDNIEKCVLRQKEILKYASTMVKKDGYLLYSTCTYELEENEKMIEWFIKNYNYEVNSLKSNINQYSIKGIKTNVNTNLSRRFYPHISPGEGQFVCLLKNNNDIKEKVNTKKHQLPNQKEMNIINSFLSNINKKMDIYVIKDKVYNSIIELPININVVSSGVQIGILKEKYLFPNHYFFKAFGEYFKHKLNLDISDNRVLKYLHGEEIEADIPNGFGILMVNGYPLGGFKASNNKLKNHYPKGLRIN